MNTRLFLFGLCLTLLVACSTSKKQAMTPPIATSEVHVPQKFRNKTPVKGTLQDSPETASIEDSSARNSEEKSHVYKEDPEAEAQTGFGAYMKLMEIMSQQTNSDVNNMIYPDYYGGAYIDDSQHLVVLITEEGSASYGVKELKGQLKKDIIYRTCRNSYNSLIQIQDSIKAQFERKTPLALNIIAFGIREDKNKVEILLHDISEDKQKELFETVDKDKVMIAKSEPIIIIED